MIWGCNNPVNSEDVKVYPFESLRICSCLSCVYRVMDARGKFGEHEKCVRVARGASVTDNCEWKAQNLRRKWRKSKLNELVSLKNVLKVKDPKLSRVLIVQNNIYAAVHGAIGEDRLKVIFKKMLTSSYLRTGVLK